MKTPREIQSNWKSINSTLQCNDFWRSCLISRRFRSPRLASHHQTAWRWERNLNKTVLKRITRWRIYLHWRLFSGLHQALMAFKHDVWSKFDCYLLRFKRLTGRDQNSFKGFIQEKQQFNWSISTNFKRIIDRWKVKRWSELHQASSYRVTSR